VICNKLENKLSDLHVDLIKASIKYKGLNMLFLSQVLIGDDFLGSLESWHYINILKKIGLENVVKFLAFNVSNLFLKRRHDRRFNYLFINEVNNIPSIDALNLVYREFNGENVGMVISDVRLGKLDERTINIFEFATLGVLWKSLIGSVGLIPVLYRLRGELNCISRKYNIRPLFLILNIFDSVFAINTVDVFFANVSAGKIVLMTDVHKISRICTLRAGELEIPTYVIQHGATVGEEGYIPVIADKMLVWGQSSKNWFVERGQSPYKLEIVGSPRMDSVIYGGVQSSHPNGDGWRKVLIVMSMVSFERAFLVTVKEALMKCGISGVEVIIKLHPGGAVDYSFMPREVFDASGLSYRILRFENTKALLKETDIVIVTNSTVGMEAIIENKPIFQFKSSQYFNHRMSYEDFDCSHLFETGDQLRDLISNPITAYSKVPNYGAFVDFYFGKLDGNSSKRAKDFIVSHSLKQDC